MSTPESLQTRIAGEHPTRVRYQVMAFLCALSFLTYFDRVCIMRAKGDIVATLGLTNQQMGWIMGTFWFAYGIFEIPSGWLGDRFGPRSALSRIVLAWSLFTALSGSATGFMSLLLWRFLFGAGEAGAYPNMARVQSQWLPVESRARAGGLLWLMARWGGAFSPLLFGAMLVAFNSEGFRSFLATTPGLSWMSALPAWRFAFWAAGFVGVIWVLAFYFWFRDDPRQKPTVNAAELNVIEGGRGKQPERHTMSRDAWKALFTCRSLWCIGLLYFFGGIGWSFFVSWAPEYLRQVHGQQFQQTEIQTGMPLFFGGISCLVGGTLCDWCVRRTGRKRLFRALFPMTGYLTAAAAMFCIPLTRTSGEAVALFCLAAAAHDFGQGANWASIVDIGGMYAGVAAGLINMIGNQANFIQPPLGAWVFENHGWNALFVVYSCTYLVATCMWLFINPNQRFYERAEPRGFPVASVVKPADHG